MEWMELRSMWNKNVATLDANEIAEAQRILKKNNLRVTDIASPLFKVDFAGRAEIEVQPGARSVQRELYLRPAG